MHKLKPLKRKRIQSELIISFLLLSLIPTFIVGIFAYYRLTDVIETKTVDYSQQILNKTSDNIQTTIGDVNLICDEILIHESVQFGLNNYDEIDIIEKREIILDIAKYFTGRYQLLQYLTEVEIITNDDDVLYTSGYCSFSKGEFEEIRRMADELDGMVGWSNVWLKQRDNILIYRKIKSERSKEGIGYLIIALDEKVFSNIYSDVSLGENTDIFIIDSLGNTISSTKNDIVIGQVYENTELVSKVFKEQDETPFLLTMNENKHMILHTILNRDRWALVSTIPYSNFAKEPRKVMVNLIRVSVVCIIFIILLSVILSKIIWGPLGKLITHMKEVEKGNFDVNIELEGRDEIGYLFMSFNKMVKQIERLIEDVKIEKDEKREIEIQMLQAQINPHFLFNTLNSLKWTAKMSQANSVSKGLDALAAILRNTIIDKNEFISIREELTNINNYMIIQKLRYGSSFDLENNIEEKALDYKILKFLLQPMIENSIIHGQNNIDHMLKIELSSYIEDNKLHIIIKDNGSGVEQEEINRYLELDYKKKEKFSNIGISNVRDRIKLNFGLEYGLEIKGEKGVGTRVELVIPIRQ